MSLKNNDKNKYLATKRLIYLSASTNTLLALIKVVVGYLSYSQALIADGLHSFSDLLSDGLVLGAARLSGRIPDEDHPYGHQRIETIAAIALAILMFIVGTSILYHSLHHLLDAQQGNTHSLPVIIISILAIFAYELLYRYNRYMAEQTHSNLLLANSYHNRSDAFTSAIVMISAIGGFLHIHYLDAIAATVIGAFIIKMGANIFWSNLQELIDAGVDANTLIKIQTCLQQVPGVISVHQLRTRLHSGTIFVDVHIIVHPTISVSEGHYISEQVHSTLIQQFPKIIDVIVHIDPEDDEEEYPSIHLLSRPALLQLLAENWRELPGYPALKQITIHYLNGYIQLQAVLPLQITQTITPNILVKQYQAITEKVDEITQVDIVFTSAD